MLNVEETKVAKERWRFGEGLSLVFVGSKGSWVMFLYVPTFGY